MAVIGVTGGTGMVGRQLLPILSGMGHNVVIFTRNPAGRPSYPGCQYAYWDPEQSVCDASALGMLDAMVHLAGEPVAAKRWTLAQKQRLTNSRVQGTGFLVSQLREYAYRCKTLIAASATGYYGQDKGGVFTETSPPGEGFLANICADWEASIHTADSFLRVVALRIGIVLGREGGAYPEFVKPLSFGVMPVLGSGRQVISWVHVADIARLIVYALEKPDMRGTYNAVAPHPVTNKELMLALAKAKGGFHLQFRVPSFVIRLLLGEMSIEVLKSCTAAADKTLQTGFVFNYPDIGSAARDLVLTR